MASEAVRRAYDDFSFLMRSMDEDDTKPLLTNAMKITLDDVNEACELGGPEKISNTFRLLQTSLTDVVFDAEAENDLHFEVRGRTPEHKSNF